MRRLLLLAALCSVFGTNGYTQSYLSLEDAAAILYSNNNAIKISQKGVDIAKAQRAQLNSAWYPVISAQGGYFHFSNDISAQANLGETAQDALESISQAFPGIEQLLQQLLPQLQQTLGSLGNVTLSFPLLDQNITSLDAVALWPLITGGKRIFAGKIGKELQLQAQELDNLTTNAQMALMLNAYYTLKLARQVNQMNRENLLFMDKLLYNAVRLKQEGFITSSELLVVEVAKDEATRELESSVQSVQVATSVLSTILGKEIQEADLTGSWFTLNTLPDTSSINHSLLQRNSQLKILEHQANMTENQERIAKSNYLPDIALFARQNIYSHNVPKNLIPRTTVGAAMQWDLFDGLNREKEIKKSRLEQDQLKYAIEQTRQELLTAALALRGKMVNAIFNINTLKNTMQLAQQLLTQREKSFAEGMCTSTDVIAAQTSVTRARTALDLAYWEYCTSLANLLALSSDTNKFIELHNEYRK